MFCIPIQHVSRILYQPIAVCLTPAWALAWPLTNDAQFACAAAEGVEVEAFEWRTAWGERLSVQRSLFGWSVAVEDDEIMTHDDPQILAAVTSFLAQTVPFIACAPHSVPTTISHLNDGMTRIVWQHTFATNHPLPTIAIGRAPQTQCAVWAVKGWKVSVRVDLAPYGREGVLQVRSGTEAKPAALETADGDHVFRRIIDLARWVNRV